MPERNALDLITGDSGRVEIPATMRVGDGYMDKITALEDAMVNQFPHLEFWIGESVASGAIVISWEPRQAPATPTENP